MIESFFNIKSKLFHFSYRYMIKPIFFLIDPETMHDWACKSSKIIGKSKILQRITSVMFEYKNSMLTQKINGVEYPNPIGISGGFDKNGVMTQCLPFVGFGYLEIGSVTHLPYKGNKGKHLWRLKDDKSLVVNYGLKNIGSSKIHQNIIKLKKQIPWGINIARSNREEVSGLKDSINDYISSIKIFNDLADYFCINVSCPNAHTGYMFLEPKKLNQLLIEIDKLKLKKPVYIKFAADLREAEVEKLVKVALRHKVDGFICTNLTKKRNGLKSKNIPNTGGISGKAVKAKSTKTVKQIYKLTKGKKTIIGCGGIFNAKDAYEKIKAGANLIQLITGMIFEGPQLIGEINQGLVKLMKKDGYKNISQAIGKDVKFQE